MLFNHAPLLSEIGVGEVKLVDPEGNVRRYATSGGFVDVKKNHAVMLAETVERVDEIDAARAEAARERAGNRLKEKKEMDLARTRSALERARNRLRVAGKG